MRIISITYHNTTGMEGRLRVQATIPCLGFALVADKLRSPCQLEIMGISLICNGDPHGTT